MKKNKNLVNVIDKKKICITFLHHYKLINLIGENVSFCINTNERSKYGVSRLFTDLI